ncbi:MAG: DUF4886 domain-containing protein [Clostridia bacterium]|nr:DUF4886 domain-containing protein [Clostridia bacterium]
MNQLRFLSILLLSSLLLLTSCSTSLSTDETKEETLETVQEKESVTSDIIKKEDPKNDDVMNILMIGNSGCYYYTDELYEIGKAAGIKMNVCNIYYSGCTLEQHWTWWKHNESNYERFIQTNDFGKSQTTNVSLKWCLTQANWDIITLQEAFSPSKALDKEACLSSSRVYLKGLLEYLKEEFPKSEFLWHQTWSYEVGYNQANGVIENKEQQNAHHETVSFVSKALCDEFSLKRIPVGDAWQIAREDTRVGDTLCHKNGAVGDFLHDGDTGGGQYLNACVWFEVLTGKSCIGNTFRPDYDLSEEKISALQEAAHKSVENLSGGSYEKN